MGLECSSDSESDDKPPVYMVYVWIVEISISPLGPPGEDYCKYKDVLVDCKPG